MDKPLVLDTNVLIEHLRGRPGAAEFFEGLASKPFVSAVTIAELFAGARDELACLELDRFLSSFEVVPVTTDLARSAGLLRQAHETGLGDAIIAATAEALGATLMTFNPRDFQMLRQVQEPYAR